MKVNYVLMYGTPYLRYEEFEKFEDMSKFIVRKRIVNYTIFEKMSDEKEVEMIYRDNDIKVLENAINKANKYLDNLKTYHFKYGMPSENGTKIIGCENDFVHELKEILNLKKGGTKC